MNILLCPSRTQVGIKSGLHYALDAPMAVLEGREGEGQDAEFPMMSGYKVPNGVWGMSEAFNAAVCRSQDRFFHAQHRLEREEKNRPLKWFILLQTGPDMDMGWVDPWVGLG